MMWLKFHCKWTLEYWCKSRMSEAPEEAEEFYKVAGALLINIGTLTKANEKDILEIGKIANQQGTPIVFDPVL